MFREMGSRLLHMRTTDVIKVIFALTLGGLTFSSAAIVGLYLGYEDGFESGKRLATLICHRKYEYTKSDRCDTIPCQMY
jgi:hypothetical protein